MKNRFKELRKTLGLTQEEFGGKLGRSKRAIIYYENGERTPDKSFLLLIADKFSVNPVWLSTGQGEMFLSTELHSDFLDNERVKGSSAHNLVYQAIKKMSKSEAEELLKYIEERELLKEARKNMEPKGSMRRKIEGE